MTEELGHRLVSGLAGGSWAQRAMRVRSLFNHLYGPHGPETLTLVETAKALEHSAQEHSPSISLQKEEQGTGGACISTPGSFPRPLGPALLRQARAETEASAKRFLNLLAARETHQLAACLSDTPWVLWPDGTLAKHRREPLLTALGERPGHPIKAVVQRIRSYSPAEADAFLARGIAAAHRFLADAPSTWITAEVDVPKMGSVRTLLVVDPNSRDAVRFCNLPVGAPDEPLLAGRAFRPYEDEAVRLGERFVRAWLLGHTSALRSLRSQVMDRILVADDVVALEELAYGLESSEPLLSAGDLAFLGSRKLTEKERKGLTRPSLDELARRAPELWHLTLQFGSAQVVQTEFGRFFANEGRVGDRRRLLSLLLRSWEADGTGGERLRWRVASVWEG